jgi:ribose 5-phosphate isomerase B
MRVGIATDHGGFALKEELVTQLRTAGHEVVDFGAFHLTEGDAYPDYVMPLAQAVVAGKVDRGVAICGSGVGASVCANKVSGVRAALIHDHFSARQGVEDDRWPECPSATARADRKEASQGSAAPAVRWRQSGRR